MTAIRPIPGPAGPTGATGATGATGPAGAPGGASHVYKSYASFSSGATDYWSAPDAAALDITGRLDIRVLILPTIWNPASNKTMVAKWATSGNQRSYMLSHCAVGGKGGMIFQFSTAGTSAVSITSANGIDPAALPTTGPIWMRCVALPDDGTGKSSATFYYSIDDQVTWVQIGLTAVTNATPGPWFSGSSILQIGNTGSATPFAGRIYKAHIYNDLVRAATFDATNLAAVAAFTDGDSRTWTPAATAAIASDPYISDQDVIDGSIRSTAIHGASSASGGYGGFNIDASGLVKNDGVTDIGVPLTAALLAIPHGTAEFSQHGAAYVVKHPIIVPNGVKLTGQNAMQGGTVLRADSTFPHTTISGTQTTPSDTLTDFALTVVSTALFPFGVGGITPPNGVGVLCVAGITIFYTGTTATTFTGCRVGGADVSVSLANGRAVSTFMIWLTAPNDQGGGFGTRIENMTVDCNSIAGISGVFTAHIQEGGGWENIVITKFANFGFRLDDADPIQTGLAQHAANYECHKAWIIFSSAAETEAVGIDIMHWYQVHGPGSDRGIDDVTIVVQGSATIVGKAGIRLNGCTGTYDDHHYENLHIGMLVGDKYRCVILVRNVNNGNQWGTASDDACVQLGNTSTNCFHGNLISRGGGSGTTGRKVIRDLVNSITVTNEVVNYSLYQDSRYRIDNGAALAASKPAATAVPVGADIYDATNGPQWSNGTNWKKADGTIV